MSTKKSLSVEETREIIGVLKKRFESNASRHPGIKWEKIEKSLLNQPDKLLIIKKMEETGGEPEIVKLDENSGKIWIFDCSAESPNERRSLCYDEASWESRKQNKPKSSAVQMAKEIGIEILAEEDYQFLQTLGEFDLKTSSWISTPKSIRELGGAIFGDRRFSRVFIYHNGAESYYAARGFRGKLSI